ncbi:MAG: hypothetical protein WCH46_01250 [bacterium]
MMGQNRTNPGASGGVYGLAFIGAVVYYIQHATSFGDGLVGILKALIWPAILIYHVLEKLHL